MALYNAGGLDPQNLTGFENAFLNQDPSNAFSRFMSLLSGSPNPRGLRQGLQDNYNDIYSGYLSREARNPTYLFTDYLRQNGNQIANQYDNPYSRGERPNSFIGRLRYVF